MMRPAELQSDEILMWSPGRGTDVWALFEACAEGDLPTVKALIARDPSLARSQYAYRKPLYFAVRENRIDVAEFLLEHDSNPLDLWVDGKDPIAIARAPGYTAMERMLERTLAGKFNASSKGEAVAAALRKYKLEAMRRLLDADPSLLHAGDRGSSQPIHWATMTRQLDAINDLLARGANVDARRMDGARPIHLFNGDYSYRGWRDVKKSWPTTPQQVLSHLIERGATVDISTAALLGDIDRVRALLDQDPSLVNNIDHLGYYAGAGTPLRNAAAQGHLEIVRLLLERGADPNLREEQVAPKGAALYSAVYHGHYDIAKLLLEHGAFPNPPVESSGDAMSIATSNKDTRMVELLRSHGAKRPLELYGPGPRRGWLDLLKPRGR